MAGMAELEATLSRYKATQNELEATMQTIASVARSLEDVGQEAEVAKLEEALASCAKSMQSVKNQMVALKEVKALPQVSLMRPAAVSLAHYPHSVELAHTIYSMFLFVSPCASHFAATTHSITSSLTARPQLLEDDFNEVAWYKKRFDELQAESERSGSWKRQEKYRELRVQLWGINHHGEPLPDEEGDEDLMVVRTQEESFICPITKVEFVEPFKKCGPSLPSLPPSRHLSFVA